MKVDNRWRRSIWRETDSGRIRAIDQTRLPHRFEIFEIETVGDAVRAIADMQVRGAPLIGATAAYGLALALADDDGDARLAAATDRLLAARPTAVNLRWALERMNDALRGMPAGERANRALVEADRLCDEDAAVNESIGDHGLALIRDRFETTGDTVDILTHCNAGWLATVDWGTALAPVYKAHDAGIPVHVWVDETRPRNQGASLTMWELMNHGVPCTLVVDNAGGHLMQRGDVDLVIVGSDRTTANGDVCNKIGTYLKALAAFDNNVPFHVALPCSTIDWTMESGARVPIEERHEREVLEVIGTHGDRTASVRVSVPGARAANPAFDVTPARLVTGYVTERGRFANIANIRR
ncbi:MAG: S-methyl-5-thioribose-1-phosphate isomerase [Proteobacteria bacterium]|nr:MAG: S-methyl-5-thioribose-1-phosphate isomerase [Pseudomonadota bacterium]